MHKNSKFQKVENGYKIDLNHLQSLKNLRKTIFNRSLHRRVWGEFSFFFVCALDIFKVWCEESFFCKKHFCSNKCKNAILPTKKKESWILITPIRSFERILKSNLSIFWEFFYLEFIFFIKVRSKKEKTSFLKITRTNSFFVRF